MNVVILAGGLGTRLTEETELRPKPMVNIGDRPILWHIMKHYAHHGFQDFHLALGYKGEEIKRYFLDYHALQGRITVDLADGSVQRAAQAREAWRVHLLDTGVHTNTGGRVRRLRADVGQGTFMLSYGDGVANVDLRALLAFHREHGRTATVTAVRPPARFGELVFEGDRVCWFAEKNQAREGWINGGFMVLEPRVFDYLQDDDASLEHDALARLAADGELFAYRHEGFWQCMDTLRDKRQLQALWEAGTALWKVWS